MPPLYRSGALGTDSYACSHFGSIAGASVVSGIKTCPQCEKVYASKFRSCPHCRSPNASSTGIAGWIATIPLVGMAALLLFAMRSCDPSNRPSTSDQPNAAQAELEGKARAMGLPLTDYLMASSDSDAAYADCTLPRS